MLDKFGATLFLDWTNFKKGLNEASRLTKAFGQGVKESFKEQVQKSFDSFKFKKEKTSPTGTGYEKQIEFVKDQMDAVMDQIKEIKLGGKQGNLSGLEAQYEILGNKLETLTEKQKEFNGELDETNKTSMKASFSLSELFDKSVGKIKRFTYYLLGARSVFSLFMRYRSIYYQYNEEMQYQSELSQNAIALSLAPAFEFLGNIITYASIGLAKFIELLTGVNVLSKVTTKGIRDYNKSLKETQTLVTGIDEITNLTNPQNLGLASQYQALADFQQKVKEVEAFFERNKWIQNIIDGLKKIVENVGGAENALKLLGGVAVMTAIGKLIGTGGIGGTGLLGVLGALTAIAGTYIIYLQLNYSDELAKIMGKKTEPKDNKKNYDELIKQTDKLADKLKKLNKNSQEYKDTVHLINQKWGAINSTIQLGHQDILDDLDDTKKLALKLQDITNENSYSDTVKLSGVLGLNNLEDDLRSAKQKIEDWFTGNDKTYENKRKAYSNFYQEQYNNLLEYEKKLNKITSKTYKIKFAVEVVAEIGKKVTAGAEALQQEVLKAIRGYASGLDYVPYDNYPALLHKGEAVVPAKYNPTIHSQGNEYTNSLLETLVMKVDDLASRPNVFEIDGQKFAQATYNLYDTQRKIQGYVEGVVR